MFITEVCSSSSVSSMCMVDMKLKKSGQLVRENGFKKMSLEGKSICSYCER
jgi:hypothetical protein